MASKKVSGLLEDPPSASPSQCHEEEEEDLEETQVEESEEEDFEDAQGDELTEKTPHISIYSRTLQIQSGDESSEGEEEGSATDNYNTKHSSPNASNFIIKPTVNKNNHSMEPTKPVTKRALVDAKGRKDLSKKTKVAKGHSEKDRNGNTIMAGPGSGRIWNPDDVITILEGMIEYQKQKGADPHANMGSFLEFVKGRFGFEVTKSQLYEKVRSLKKKFLAVLQKGESYIPTKPHDLECFDLSKKIWGGNDVDGTVGNSGSVANDVVVGNGVDHIENVKIINANAVDHTENVKIVDGVSVTKKSVNGKSSEKKLKDKEEKKKKESDRKNTKKKDYGPNIVEKEAELVSDKDIMKDKDNVVNDGGEGLNNYENVVEDNEQNIMLKYPNLTASLSIDLPDSQKKLMMEGICLVDSEKAIELDSCWKELRMKEAEFYCRKLELMAEQSRLVMDALKKQR